MAGEQQEKAWSKEKIKARIEGHELDLSLCSISKVPVNFILPFSKVLALDLSCNRINALPENFPKLSQLVQLDLSKNSITELPDDFGELTSLKKLDLFKNNLCALPLSVHKLKNLQWLDLKANPIQETYSKLVGDCLNPKECQQCAKNIIGYYSKLYNEKLVQERKARKIESERLAKEKEEEDQIRQRRKQEKKRRLEEKKLENQNKNEKVIGENVVTNEEMVTSSSVESVSGWSCTRCFTYILFLMITGFLVMVVVFKGNMQEIKEHINLMVNQSGSYLEKLSKKFLE